MEFLHEPNECLIIGLVGAVGGRLKSLSNILKSILNSEFNYEVHEIRVSQLFLEPEVNLENKNQYERYEILMDVGNELRKKNHTGYIAHKVVKHIHFEKKKSENKRKAFIINSLKHESEIKALRDIYGKNFFQISLYESPEVRNDVLINDIGMTVEQAGKLMERDEGEKNDYGQHTRDAFHLADYFIKFDNKNNNQIKNSCSRFLELIFGNPYRTPTFNEFAMYMAFTSSLRSADLSRQVGAVLARDRNIIATGANDIPKFGGGQYWPEYDNNSGSIDDIDGGRDYKRGNGFDSNEKEREEIINEIFNKVTNHFESFFNDESTEHIKNKKLLKDLISKSSLKDITEYGRVVHAEMDALMSCGRTNNSTVGSTIYVTTFPCHNCAKHIISAGIKELIFIEPYPKSKALELWSDSVVLKSTKTDSNKLIFHPFVGVGPRSFLDLFSMALGAGSEIKRKQKGNTLVGWDSKSAVLRLSTNIFSLKEIELDIAKKIDEVES